MVIILIVGMLILSMVLVRFYQNQARMSHNVTEKQAKEMKDEIKKWQTRAIENFKLLKGIQKKMGS